MNTVGPDKRLNYYRMSATDVVADLHSQLVGLDSTEARHRIEVNGANMLNRTRHDSWILVFGRQFKNFFIVILIASAVCSLYLHDGKTATILFFIAFMNAAVGFIQEYKAETLMERLEQLVVSRAKVMRDGMLRDIDAQELVLGDIVAVESGDSIPADLRLVDEDELTTNDFALTGESDPARKFVHAITDDVPFAYRHNLVFMGTTVASGSAHGIVIATGMHTELGRIASLSQLAQSDPSPLQKEMNHLATRITQATVALAAILVLIALRADLGLKDALLFGIGIGAAMIPNGLATEVNVTLAQAASRMAKARALVKKLSAVETLGATNIILTDKTGTLTKNEMTITDLFIGREHYMVDGIGYIPEGTLSNAEHRVLSKRKMSAIAMFFEAAALACNAKVNPPDDEHAVWYVVGDPTEGAIITLARKVGFNTQQLDEQNHEIKEFQFDAGRKLMTSVRTYNGKTVAFVKGAPEAVFARCVSLWDHGHVRKFTAADKAFFTNVNDVEAVKAMRNIAVAYRVLDKDVEADSTGMQRIERNLTFLGMVSMHDPLRSDISSAMIAARSAHVAVSIVTGDYPATAKAIAYKSSLAEPGVDITILTPEEFESLSDSQILQFVETGGTVFSRVSPEDKLRIVEIAKASGQVVAVTGDGINDAPALKRSDIGVAMGKSGTDVAKEAAEIVLLDDSFSTLVRAIRQGRLTFVNIRKAARCAMTDNAGELGTILLSLAGQTFFHFPLAISAIQILAIDLIAEMAPITALGWDKAPRGLMHEHPRRLSDHILNSASAREFITFGMLAAGIAYANFMFYFVRRGIGPAFIDRTSGLYASATSLTYVTLVLCQFVNLLLVRADEHESVFTSYLWSNKRLLIAFALSFICILNLLYNPFVRSYFGTGVLQLSDWIVAIIAAATYLGIRLLQRHSRKFTRQAVIKLHHTTGTAL